MRGKSRWIGFLIVVIFLFKISLVEASLIINEILFDPPSGLVGDANLDGVRSSGADEFIELYNSGIGGIDISSWSMTDGVATRHVFPLNTIIDPYTFLVVFGGGNPILPDIKWQIASTGGLSLNNSGDSVTLIDSGSGIIDQVILGKIAGNDQSVNLFLDGEGSEFFLHSTLEQAQGSLFSPGTSVDGKISLAINKNEEIPNIPMVPEFSTFAYLVFGWGSMLLKKNF